jgi:hypothetical protein
MKTIIAVAIILTATGCGRVENFWSGVKSYTGTIDRTVILYNANGQPIKQWNTNNEIEYSGPVAKFIDKEGSTVRISGTFVVEGK